ncbi:hypothetical protein O165_029045 [Pseudomonas soli]|nr:hypothetical protein O165_029045 [Pseudomonas soli]
MTAWCSRSSSLCLRREWRDADEAGNLDFSLLGDADVLVYLDPDDRWVVGQAVTLVWVGMTANGSRLAPVIKHAN